MVQVHNPKTDEEFADLIKKVPADGFVALNFYTSWATPCKQMNQTFVALASVQPETSLFISIDAEELPDVSEEYDVTAVPYFVLLKGTTRLKIISGADSRALQEQIELYSSSTSNATGTTIPPAQQTAAPEESADSSNSNTEEEPLDKRLAKLVAAAPVMLFMKGTPAAPQCGFSRQMVALLRDRAVRYGFFNILADDEVRQGLKEFSNWPTYPQLYVGGELVGGLDIVKEEFENDPDFLKNVTV